MKSVIIFLIIFTFPLAFADYPQTVEDTERYTITQIDEDTFVFETKPCDDCIVIENHEQEFIDWMKYGYKISDNTSLIDIEIQEEKEINFGVVIAMILAVAIISIIAISAKSRLDIVPRY